MIQTLMVPEAILQHSVWSTVSSGCGCLARFEETAISMSNVMLAVLSQSKAWTVLDQVDAKNLDFQKLDAVSPLLLEFGMQPDIVDVWSTKLLPASTEDKHPIK